MATKRRAVYRWGNVHMTHSPHHLHINSTITNSVSHQHVTNSMSHLHTTHSTHHLRINSTITNSMSHLHVTNSMSHLHTTHTTHHLYINSTITNSMSHQHVTNSMSHLRDSLSHLHMRLLRWVGSLQTQVSCAKEPYKRDSILQKRKKSRSLLQNIVSFIGLFCKRDLCF